MIIRIWQAFGLNMFIVLISSMLLVLNAMLPKIPRIGVDKGRWGVIGTDKNRSRPVGPKGPM